MNNATGDKELKSLDALFDKHRKKVGSPIIGLVASARYRAVYNSTGATTELQGLALFQHILNLCGTLTHWTVAARMSFYRIA